MPIEKLTTVDFSSGVLERKHASSFADTHAAAIDGFLLQTDGTLRSQWPFQTVEAGVDDYALFDDMIVLRKGSTWYWATEPPGTAQSPLGSLSLTVLSITHEGELAVAGPVPHQLSSGVWVNALLLNGHGAANAYILYREGGLGPMTVETVSNRYPTQTGQTAIPRASVVTTWGDYVVHGDIEWMQDQTATFGAGNAARYPHGLWFSRPANLTSYDTIDTEFVAQKDKDNTITGLYPTDSGLIVLTGSGAWLLRGTPDNHEFEELRPGLAPDATKGSTYWSETGAVAFIDGDGRVWHTDGASFIRLDDPLDDSAQADQHFAAQFRRFLLVGRGNRMHAFRAFGDEGAWTTLVLPQTPVDATPSETALYVRFEDGTLGRFAPDVPGERGKWDGSQLDARLTLASRTFASGQHNTTFWHRFGVRCSEGANGAKLTSARMSPAPYLSNDLSGVSHDDDVPLEERTAVVRQGHGPSVEASAIFEFVGDLIVEALTVWVHRGKEDR